MSDPKVLTVEEVAAIWAAAAIYELPFAAKCDLKYLCDSHEVLRAQVETLTAELATCCLCEYEFDDGPQVQGRGRQVVCGHCWPHDADARGWQKRAEAAEAQVASLQAQITATAWVRSDGVAATPPAPEPDGREPR